ncbi:hypothetical protein CCAN11_2280007 [Capnocytophaga canimorsus]|uniref:Uncharacterized protein n=1 Tax=Capnocytophaga canimorsus TaxID=28188 RepID=A0A0B7IL22_9FLAO|nr:hypothetical protein CCAN11_2280007 [Capnocytophaga canimorsus]
MPNLEIAAVQCGVDLINNIFYQE